MAVALNLVDPWHARDEAIASSGYSLYEAWLFGIVPEGLTYLAYRGVDSVLGIEEDVIAPEPGDDFFARHQVPIPLYQEDEQLHGNALEFQQPAGAAQFKAGRVQL